MDHLAQRVLGWTLMWFTLYHTSCKILRSKGAEYNCRIVTLVHATTITISSCYISFFYGTNPFTISGTPNSPEQLFIITVSLGYFLYDFAWCLYHQSEGPVMLLHHVISVSFMIVCLCLGVSGIEVVTTIFGSEVTSVFLNIRWFMKEHNVYSGTYVGLIIDYLFVALFIGVRIGVGGYLMFSVLQSSKSPVIVKVGGFSLYCVNCFFLFQILSFARHRFTKSLTGQSTKNSKEKLSGTTIRNGSTSSPCRNGKVLINGHSHKKEIVCDALVYSSGDFESSPFLSG
ncbi:TLC domain-containing protein 5-like [Clavelina lepadiformis]|uniref:TLC domain-containing protein 5-like n=1 Tax=Clavelina lepadiformis TaxID=159417 RepID=UPI0040422302